MDVESASILPTSPLSVMKLPDNMDTNSVSQPKRPRILHMTVGTAPQSQLLDPTHDLRLLKAALLYADKVKLCSVTSSYLAVFSQIENLSDREFFELLMQVMTPKILGFDLNPKIVAEQLYEAITTKKISRTLLPFSRKQLSVMRQKRRELQASITEMVPPTAARDFETAEKSGLVEFHIFKNAATDLQIGEFVDIVGNAVVSGTTFPLFDDFVGDLLNLAIKEGVIQPTRSSATRAKQVGLSTDLFSRLPLFDNVPVQEILDIRKELERPLIRFRSAMSEFADDVESAAWDKDFPAEAERIFFEKAAPAVLEIEEAYKSNNALLTLVSKFNEKPLALPVTSVLGILLSTQSQLPALVTQALALTAGAAAIALEAAKEWREKNEAIERNQLYFYYRVAKKLDTRTQKSSTS